MKMSLFITAIILQCDKNNCKLYLTIVNKIFENRYTYLFSSLKKYKKHQFRIIVTWSYEIRFAKFIQPFIEILFFIIDIQICFSVLHVSSLHQRRLQRFVYNACTYTLEVTSKIIFSKSLKMNINIFKWFCRTRSHTHWYVVT